MKRHSINATRTQQFNMSVRSIVSITRLSPTSTRDRVFADGDYVLLHVHRMRTPGTRGDAIVDIFRLQDGKIAEHWDAIQPIPETSANANTMF
jgi:predicted SnoaL-like aldol condensation-catalyzing enzyme